MSPNKECWETARKVAVGKVGTKKGWLEIQSPHVTAYPKKIAKKEWVVMEKKACGETKN